MRRRSRLALAAGLLLAACSSPGSAGMSNPSPMTPTATSAQTSGVVVPVPSNLTVLIAMYHEPDGGSLHLVDAHTGDDLPAHPPIPLGANFWHAISPDGRTLAVVSYADAGATTPGDVRLIDLGTWTERGTEVTIDPWPNVLAFSPDSSQLAIGSTTLAAHRIVVVDVASGAALADRLLDFSPLQIEFDPDGAALLAYGRRYSGSAGLNPIPVAASLDPGSLADEWETEIPGVKDGQYAGEDLSEQELHDQSIWWQPAVVFAPRSRRLYVVHADEDRLTTVDFATKTIGSIAIDPATSWLERLLAFGSFPAYAKVLNGSSKVGMLSADGGRLYVIGWKVQSTPNADGSVNLDESSLGLTVIDVASGRSLATADTTARTIGRLPDGDLLLGGWDSAGTPWTDVLTIDSLQLRAHLPDLDLLRGAPIPGTPWVAVAARAGVRILTSTTWDVASEWTAPGSYTETWQASTLPPP